MKLRDSIKEIIKLLDSIEKRQDKVLLLSREIIRDCANSIKCIHSRELKEAEKILLKLGSKIRELKKYDAGLENVSQQTYQEYVEVMSLYSVLKQKEIPGYKELGVPPVSYLNGLADLIGELRREIQVSLKEGNRDRAEYFFNCMNEVYENLIVIKYASSIVGGLRRKLDVGRIQIEQARSELLK